MQHVQNDLFLTLQGICTLKGYCLNLLKAVTAPDYT